MGLNLTIDALAQSLAQWYQGQVRTDDKAGEAANRKDLPRVVYNIKQIAFNVSTVSAIAMAIFAVIGRVSLPYGLAMTALFFAARLLVQKDIEEMLLGYSGKVGELLGKGMQKVINVPTLENSVLVYSHINSARSVHEWQTIREDWVPVACKFQGEPIWRNLVLSEDLNK